MGIIRVGLAMLISNTFWLSVTGLLFVPVAALAFLYLSILLTVPFALDRLLSHRFGGLIATLVFPASRVGMEYLFVVTAVFGSWGALGATQHSNLWLIQIASVTGVYGVSFTVAWFASLVNWAWERGFEWQAIQRNVLVYLGVAVVLLGAGVARLLFFAPTWHTVRVAGISASRAAEAAGRDALKKVAERYWQAEKVSAADPVRVGEAFAHINDDLVAGTEREARAGAKIVLWPESQAMVLQRDAEALVDRVKNVATQHDVYVNMAFALYTGQDDSIRNLAILVTPQGRLVWTYDKAHPTPMEPMKPGPADVPVADSPYGRLANVICYDADFPDLMRQAAQKGADVVLVPANDWKGFEYLHAENAVFRAVEYGYTIVRHSSHGFSTTVDRQGRILSSANYFNSERQVMVAEMPLEPRTPTLYSMVGDLFAWFCMVGTALLVFVSSFGPKSRHRVRVLSQATK